MVLLIIILGFLLRLIIIDQSLWLDEAIGTVAVSSHSISELFTGFFLVDNHPPLYYLLLKIWIQLFGHQESIIRLPSVLAGVGTIYLVYEITHKITQRKNIALVAAALLATSQIHVYYSQEARMYIFTAFFACWAFSNYISQKWVLFSISLVLLLFSDYVTVFMLAAFWVNGIVSKKPPSWWVGFISAYIPVILLGFTWLPIFIKQLENGAQFLQKLPGWQALAGGATIRQGALLWAKMTFGRVSINDTLLYAALLSVVSIPFIHGLYISSKRGYKLSKEVWIWFVLPPVLGFVFSFLIPVFIYFRFLYIVPALYILISMGAFRTKILGTLVISSIFLINIIALCMYYFDVSLQREQWRDSVKYVEQNASENDIVLFSNPETFAPYQWYQKRNIGYGGTNSISPNWEETKRIVVVNTENIETVYYYDYLSDLMDPNHYVVTALVETGFLEVSGEIFEGVGAVRKYQK